MDFTIQKAEFLKGLRLAQGIADRKSTMPMLANVLLRATGKTKLTIAATDLNLSLTAELASENAKDGGLIVGAKALYDIVNGLPGDAVTLRRGDGNRADIKSGRANYKLVGLADKDFPKMPDHREAAYENVAAARLREMLERTKFATSSDENRFHLNGALFESDGKLARMVATDGHRMAKVERPLELPSLPRGIIIPRKGMLEIERMIADVDTCALAIKPPHLFVGVPGIALAVKLIESAFPPYDAVIPKQHTCRVIVDRQLFADALKRAQLMATETRGLRLAAGDNTLVLSGNHPDIGEAREELDAQVTGSVEIGLNVRYMAEFVAAMGTDQVVLEFGGPLDPGVIKPGAGDDYVAVVMPMRLD